MKATAPADVRGVAQGNSLELAVARVGAGGLGGIIRRDQTPGLIHGVGLASLVIRPDHRGLYQELARLGEGLAQSFAASKHVQFSAALSYAGTVKAIHYHLRQTDLWHPVLGQFQVMLYDLRTASPTFGQINTIYTGTLRPLQILIPPG